MYHNHTEHTNKLLKKKADIAVPNAIAMAVSTPTKAEYDALATAFNALVTQLKDIKTQIG
jgi:HAMP domain-containing protein